MRVHELRERRYELRPDHRLPGIGLGLTLWEGQFGRARASWLRWVDKNGALIPHPAERAADERRRADEQAERVRQLEALLRAQVIEPPAP